jgi:hypothetical protein
MLVVHRAMMRLGPHPPITAHESAAAAARWERPIGVARWEPADTLGRLALSSQAWFWIQEWQQGERKASADIRAGRVTTFESAPAFLESLDD